MDARAPSSLSLEERLRAALGGRTTRRVRAEAAVSAAVLVPLFERDGEPWIVFTKRTDTVRHHKGEISFPGGVREPGDPDLAATALRETHEEIGIDPALVRLVAPLDEIHTFSTGFAVTPFAAVLPADCAWAPRPDEVAEVIELPLREVDAALRVEEWQRHGTRVPMYVYDLRGYYIWGATGRILWEFLEAAGPALLGGRT